MLMSELDLAELRRRAELWLIYGDRDGFRPEDCRALLGEVRELRAAYIRALALYRQARGLSPEDPIEVVPPEQPPPTGIPESVNVWDAVRPQLLAGALGDNPPGWLGDDPEPPAADYPARGPEDST